MTSAPVIPLTPIYARYRASKALRSDAERLAAAKATCAEAATVATDFATSVAVMAERYSNSAPFRPAPKYPRPPKERNVIVEDHDLSWFVQRQGALPVADDGELSARYANYQLSVISTRGRAVFDDDKASPAGRALLMDLLLVAPDGTPIACEAKLFRDEPFSGLLQLLAYLAHIASASQRERLAKYHLSAGLASIEQQPRLDGYLLLYEFAADATYLPALLDCAEQLAEALMSLPAVSAHVRRLACLDAHLHIADAEAVGTLDATTRWRFDA